MEYYSDENDDLDTFVEGIAADVSTGSGDEAIEDNSLNQSKSKFTIYNPCNNCKLFTIHIEKNRRGILYIRYIIYSLVLFLFR